jgi:hypothetical protein
MTSFEIPDILDQEKEEIKDFGKEVKSLEAMYIEELQTFDEKGYTAGPGIRDYYLHPCILNPCE